jgi:hypothetical protein
VDLTGVSSVVALALDETHHRLFGGSNNPPILIVLDTESGKQMAQLEGVEGIDDLWYDAERDRIYASGGRAPLLASFTSINRKMPAATS